MADALIFDFDGVIVLSEQPRFKVMQSQAEMRGVSIPDNFYEKMVGQTTLTFFDTALPELSEDIRQSIIEGHAKEFKGNITQYVTPVDPVIDFLHNYEGVKPLALASMSGATVIETITRHLGIRDKFSAIITKDMVSASKPDPEIYLQAALALGIHPSDCAAIEDSRIGAAAAINAGMATFALMNGFNQPADFYGLNVGYVRTTADICQILT